MIQNDLRKVLSKVEGMPYMYILYPTGEAV